MSAVIQIEELDTALLNEIKRSVLFPGKNNYPTKLPDSNVLIRKPEEDFKIEVYPSVSIYNTTMEFDPMRYFPDGKNVKSKDIDKGIMTYTKTPVTFKMRYNIDFWSKYQTDMNMMVSSWIKTHFRKFNLHIDAENTGPFCVVVQKGDIHKSDELVKESRIFHSIIKYSIWVDLADDTLYNVPIVKSREMDLSLHQ